MSARTLAGTAALASMLLALQACGGGDGAARSDTTGAAAPVQQEPAAPAPTDTGGAATTGGAAGSDTAAAAPGAAKPAEKPAAKPAGGAASGPGSPQLVALGDSIFHGQVGGGTCTACHGQDAKGTAVAPNLTDAEWINTDGSYDGIVKTVTAGVPQPKKHPAPMPPKGGAALSDDQVKAVAAYVFSLSHKS